MINHTDIEAFKEEQLSFDWQEDPRDKTPLDMVKEFARVSGQSLGIPYVRPSKETSFRYHLIAEEFEEVTDALLPKDLLKELADLVYVTYGYAATFGWNLDEALIRVHENNMGRMYQPDGSIKRRADGKIVKNPDYPKVELEDLV
jgi:predicted HAD superfamily Cof-like phosphohydrolase